MKAKEFKERLSGKIFSIRIEDDTYGHDTSEPDPTDEWDRASTHTDHSIQGFRVGSEDDYGDLTVPFEPEKGVDYYLLYVVYSTGDSFGSDSGAGIEYIGLYSADELELAKENERRIEAHNRQREGAGQLQLIMNHGRNVEYGVHVPWKGYFEHLDYTRIESVQRLN